MDDARWRAAWTSALDELELDVDRVEALLHAGHYEALPGSGPAWTPPRVDGPLPHELRERATAILDRQLRTTALLVDAMHGNRRHAALAARLDPGAARSRPAFLDQAM